MYFSFRKFFGLIGFLPFFFGVGFAQVPPDVKNKPTGEFPKGLPPDFKNKAISEFPIGTKLITQGKQSFGPDHFEWRLTDEWEATYGGCRRVSLMFAKPKKRFEFPAGTVFTVKSKSIERFVTKPNAKGAVRIGLVSRLELDSEVGVESWIAALSYVDDVHSDGAVHVNGKNSSSYDPTRFNDPKYNTERCGIDHIVYWQFKAIEPKEE